MKNWVKKERENEEAEGGSGGGGLGDRGLFTWGPPIESDGGWGVAMVPPPTPRWGILHPGWDTMNPAETGASGGSWSLPRA